MRRIEYNILSGTVKIIIGLLPIGYILVLMAVIANQTHRSTRRTLIMPNIYYNRPNDSLDYGEVERVALANHMLSRTRRLGRIGSGILQKMRDAGYEVVGDEVLIPSFR